MVDVGAADLRRIDALLQMRAALLRFRDATSAIPATVRVRVEQAQAQLGRKQRLMEAEIAALRTQLEDCEEDEERADVRRVIGDARTELSTLRKRARDLMAAVTQHNRVAASWQQAIGNTLPAATGFLAQKHAEAVAYQNFVVACVGATSARFSEPSTIAPADEPGSRSVRAEETSTTDPITATSPDALPPLPAGLDWVPIDWVDPLELPTQEDFHKGVTYSEMHDGIQRMWQEIMPLLISKPNATRATFEEFDEMHGRVDRMGFVHPSSLAHLWDQLLDRRWGHHIRIQCDERTGQYSIDNGRHRVKVARDLGWHYVPAEFVHVHPRD